MATATSKGAAAGAVATAGTVPVNYENDAYFKMSKERIDQAAGEIRGLLNRLHQGASTGATGSFDQQQKAEMEQIQNAWDAERATVTERIKAAQEYLVSIDKTYGDQVDTVRERYAILMKQNVGGSGLSTTEEAQVRSQLTSLRSKLAALENALVSSGYTDYQPIAPVFDEIAGGAHDSEGFFDSQPGSTGGAATAAPEDAPKRLGRPKGSKNKTKTTRGRGGRKKKEEAKTTTEAPAKRGGRKKKEEAAAPPAATPTPAKKPGRPPKNAAANAAADQLTSAISTAFSHSDKKRLKIVEIADLVSAHSSMSPKTGDVLQTVNRLVEQGQISYDEGTRTYALAA